MNPGPDNDGAGYSLACPFITDNPQFTLGFEAGLLYAAMRAGEPVITNTYHSLNDEQLLLMSQRLGYEAEWERHDEHWSFGTFRKRGEHFGIPG